MINTTLQARVLSILNDYKAKGIEEGVQVAAYHNGALVLDVCTSTVTGINALRADDMIFSWSMTKGITALAMHIAVQKNLLAYDDPVARFWPAFAANGKRHITVRQLLNHTAGLPNMPRVSRTEMCDWELMCRRFAEMTPLTHPGEVPAYHAISYGWLVGEVLHRATNRTVTQFVQDEICAPLGITDLHIGLPADRTMNTARLLFDGVHGSLNLDHCGTAEMVDNPANFANQRDVQHACMPAINMMTSARALAKVYAALVGQGVNTKRLLTERTVDHVRMVQRYAIDATSQAVMVLGLGYQLPAYDTPSAMSQRRGVFGHGGWGGSISFADPDHQFAFALTKTRMVNSDDVLPVSLAVARAVRAELQIPETDRQTP